MNKFKVGDRIKVIESPYETIKVGDICTLVRITENGAGIKSPNPDAGILWFWNSEIQKCNSALIKEKLGIK